MRPCVYIFGGYNIGLFHLGALKTCEKINLQSRKWTCQSNMKKGRYLFNPCKYSGWIYLCGEGSLRIEAFSPSANLMTQLALPKLPETESGCCMYVFNNLLVVHSRNHIHKFASGPDGQLFRRTQEKSSKPVNKCSNSQPVLDSAHALFFIVRREVCLCIEMKTGVVLQKFA